MAAMGMLIVGTLSWDLCSGIPVRGVFIGSRASRGVLVARQSVLERPGTVETGSEAERLTGRSK
jgi:hypothetical protein